MSSVYIVQQPSLDVVRRERCETIPKPFETLRETHGWGKLFLKSLSLFYVDRLKKTPNKHQNPTVGIILFILQLELKFIRNTKSWKPYHAVLALISFHPNWDNEIINLVTQGFLCSWQKIFQNDWKGR